MSKGNEARALRYELEETGKHHLASLENTEQLESAEPLRGVSPWTGKPLTLVNVATHAEVKYAVSAARFAQRQWGRLSLKERYATMKRAARRLLEERAVGMSIVGEELGKVPADALFTELLGPLDALAGWQRVIHHAPAGRIGLNPLAFPDKQARIELEARGVVGIIAPWNFPIAGLYRSVFPALLLGNAIVVKPSEYSPRSSAWFLEILASELPPGLIQVVHGAADTGKALIRAGIDACVFTGSSAVGEKVEKDCVARSIVCSAEMGGNDAAIVLEGADLDRTVAGITHWALQNAGQACAAIEVVYVESSIAEDFTERLQRVWKQLRFRTTLHPSGTLAPLAQEKQKQKVLDQIESAKSLGARVLLGGQSSQLKVMPTLLADCSAEMDIVREETFGPVLPIVVVESAEDAIRQINQGKYGLTASLWTKDIERAEELIPTLDVGVVTVNNHALSGAMTDLPWAGRRASGKGIANSAWSLGTFAQLKTVVIDRSNSVEPYWAPFDPDLEALGNGLAEVQLGNLRNVYALPFLLLKRAFTLKTFFGMT